LIDCDTLTTLFASKWDGKSHLLPSPICKVAGNQPKEAKKFILQSVRKEKHFPFYL
jgi:hypothetical protein